MLRQTVSETSAKLFIKYRPWGVTEKCDKVLHWPSSLGSSPGQARLQTFSFTLGIKLKPATTRVPALISNRKIALRKNLVAIN